MRLSAPPENGQQAAGVGQTGRSVMSIRVSDFPPNDARSLSSNTVAVSLPEGGWGNRVSSPFAAGFGPNTPQDGTEEQIFQLGVERSSSRHHNSGSMHFPMLIQKIPEFDKIAEPG